MRRAATLLGVAALALAGCGDDGGSGSPLDNALGYLAEDAPLVVMIDTDLDGGQFGAANDIAERFPVGGGIEEQLEGQFEGGEVSFENDVRPLLGNEFVVGATSVTSLIDDSEDDDFVAAIEARDGDKLRELVAKEAEESGEQNGATVYEDNDGDAFAVEDDTLVVAGSAELLEGALQQRDGDGRLTEETFEDSLAGLPEEALVKVYGDIGALIESDEETEQARKVAWVGAIETLGLTASVQSDGIAIDFNLSTDGGDLSDDELPLASGAEAPEVARADDEVGAALRGVDQVFDFVKSTARAIEPQQAGQIDVVLKQVEQRTGVDLEQDVLAQLAGGVSVAVQLNGDLSGIRGEPGDPRALTRSLGELAPELPELLGSEGGRVRTIQTDGPGGSGTIYEVTDSDGDSVSFGVVDDVFVAAETPERAQAVAALEPRAVEGAEGALAFSASAEAIADAALAQLGGLAGAGSLFTGPLGDLTGSVESSTDGLRGSIRLAIDER